MQRCHGFQVSHHPPMLAQHCQATSWVCWREFGMESKFRGKYLSVNPIDITHLEFSNGNHYTWKKVTTTVRFRKEFLIIRFISLSSQ